MTENLQTNSLEQWFQSASDVGSVLELYNSIEVNSRNSYWQSVVAKKILELGNVDAALQFTILSGQTRNQELFRETALGLDNIAGSLSQSVNIFDRNVENFENSSHRIKNAAEQIEDASRRMPRKLD